MNSKQPASPPMMLGNMRELGGRGLMVRGLNPCGACSPTTSSRLNSKTRTRFTRQAA